MPDIDPKDLQEKLRNSSTSISKYFMTYKRFFNNEQVPDERGLTDFLLYHSIIDNNLPVMIHKLSSAEEAAAGLDFDLVYTTEDGKRCCICLQAKSFKPTTNGRAAADFTYRSKNQDYNQLTQLKIYIDTLNRWEAAQDKELTEEAVRLLKEAAQLRKEAARLQNAEVVEEENAEEQMKIDAAEMVKKAFEKVRAAKYIQEQMSSPFDTITGGYIVFDENRIIYIPMDGDKGLWRAYETLRQQGSGNINGKLNEQFYHPEKEDFFPLEDMIPMK